MLDIMSFPNIATSYRKGKKMLSENTYNSLSDIFKSLSRAEKIRYISADFAETIDNNDIFYYGNSGSEWLLEELTHAIENEELLKPYLNPIRKIHALLREYQQVKYSENKNSYFGTELTKGYLEKAVREFKPKLEDFLFAIERLTDNDLSRIYHSKEADRKELRDNMWEISLAQKELEKILDTLYTKTTYELEDREIVRDILNSIEQLKKDIEKAKKYLA